jgi:transposase InsO family protein
MVAWAHERGMQLRLIKPGKPNQNAYIESFNGRLRDDARPVPIAKGRDVRCAVAQRASNSAHKHYAKKGK